MKEKILLSHVGLNDVYFKTLLKENKEVLALLINGLCDLNVSKEELEFYDTELIDDVSFHTTHFDVSIKVCNTSIDIESEMKRQGDNLYYHHRELFYASRLYSQSYKEDKTIDYYKNTNCIVLFLYNFDIGTNDFKTIKSMYNRNTKEDYNDILIYEINLSKLRTDGKIEVERLLSLLKDNEVSNYLEDSSSVIRKAAKKIMGYDSNKEMRLKIEQLEDEERIKLSLLNKAKADGIEEGEKIGIEKGEKIGIVKGVSQRNYEIVKNMLASNCDIDFISKITGLSKEEILKLK